MKTKFFYLVLAVAASLSLYSCHDDDVIWDVVPTSVKIELVDAEGNSLIQPYTEEGKRLISDISVVYDKTTYHADFSMLYPPSRALLARFYGLYLVNSYDTDFSSPDYGGMTGHHLYFGEFQTESNPHISFTITWPDGQSDEVEYKVKWKNGDCSQKMWINGKKQSHPGIITHTLRSLSN